MTTYCFARTRYVIGVDWALAGNSAFHNSLPVCASNARKNVSMEAAENTSPPAVKIGPPRLGVPVCIPGTMLPNGACHFSFPVFRSNATNAPQGGVLHRVR